MKMTEKMKQELKEYMKQERAELSDEELDEVTGGRGLTSKERLEKSDLLGFYDGPRLALGYRQYIESLPEGSPEVDIYEFVHIAKDGKIVATYKCPICGTTIKDTLLDAPTCSGCGFEPKELHWSWLYE